MFPSWNNLKLCTQIINFQRRKTSASKQLAIITTSMELILSNALAHRRRRRNTTSNHLQQIIRIISTAPLLVRHNLHTTLHLRLLHKLAISAHSLLRECLGECVGDERGLVQTGQRDELPAVA